MQVPEEKHNRLRQTLLQAVLLILLLAVVFPGTFLRGEVIGPGDVLYDIPPWHLYQPPGREPAKFRVLADVVTYFAPAYATIQKSLSEGELPLWNPYQFAGMPLMANFQSSVFYPPRLLLLVLDLPWAMTTFVLLKLWFCGMCAWACGLGMGLRPGAAGFLSVAWMLSGYCVLWANWPLTDVAAWMPLLFLGVDLILRGRGAAGVLVGTAAATLLLLAGHPETAFTFSFGLGVCFLFQVLWALRFREPVVRPVLLCGLVWLLALLICAVQLAPFLEYLANSSAVQERSHGSLAYPVTAAAALWAPRFFGTWTEHNFWGSIHSHMYSMLYVGVGAWIVMALLPPLLIGASNAGDRDRPLNRRRAACLLGALCVSLLLAFDAPTIGLINRLPVFRSVIFFYHAAFAVFAVLVLAAMGLNGWTAARRSVRHFVWVPFVVLAAGAVLAGLYRFNLPVLRAQHYDAYVLRQIIRAGIFAGLSVLILAIQTVRCAPRMVPLLLTALVAADLAGAQQGLNPTLARKLFFPDTALTRQLKQLERPRRIGVSEGGVIAGPMTVFGIEDWLAYDGLFPARMWNFQRGLGKDFWVNMEPAAAINYYLNDPKYPPVMPEAKLAGMERIATEDGLDVYRNPASLPRARFVAATEIIPDFQAMLERMKAPGFEPSKIALLEQAPRSPLPPATDALPGEARVVQYGNNRVEVRYASRADGVLVLADAWYPGWKCRINGAAAEVFPVYHVFRGVVVPAGSGKAEFVYAPDSLRGGMAVSAATLLACGGWALWYLLRRGTGRACKTSAKKAVITP